MHFVIDKGRCDWAFTHCGASTTSMNSAEYLQYVHFNKLHTGKDTWALVTNSVYEILVHLWTELLWFLRLYCVTVHYIIRCLWNISIYCSTMAIDWVTLHSSRSTCCMFIHYIHNLCISYCILLYPHIYSDWTCIRLHFFCSSKDNTAAFSVLSQCWDSSWLCFL